MYFQPLREPKLIVLAGPTGSGKTAVLEALETKGYPVINLEQLAHHKGSAFGGLGASCPQPTQQAFDEAVQQQYDAFHSSLFIFTEQEAPAIGKRRIPRFLYEKMQAGIFMYLHLPKAERVRLITKDYGGFPKEDICRAIDKLSERLSPERLQELKALVRADRFPAFADSILEYYDRGYHYAAGDKAGAIHIECSLFDASAIADQVGLELSALALASA